MCNACGFLCCADDGFSRCGCEHCPSPECWDEDEGLYCDSDDDWDEDGLLAHDGDAAAGTAPPLTHGGYEHE